MSTICLFPNGLPAPGVRARFSGATYSPADDDARLTGQLLRVKGLMGDGRWRSVAEIAAITGDPATSVSAQLRFLRRPRFGGYLVERRKREGTRALFEYRLGAAGAHADKPKGSYVAKLRAELEEAHARIRHLEEQLGGGR